MLDLPLSAREPSRDEYSDALPQEGRSVRPTDSGQIRDHDGLLRWSSGEYEDTLTAEQVAKITHQLPSGGSRGDDVSLKVGGDVEDERHMPRLRQLSARALEIGAFGTNLGGRANHERGHKRGRGRERTRLARRSLHGRQSGGGDSLEAALLPTRSRSHPVLPRQGKQPLQTRSAFDLPANEKNGREEDACRKAVRGADLGERVRPLVVGGETWVRGEADGGSDDGEEHVILIDSPHQLFGAHR